MECEPFRMKLWSRFNVTALVKLLALVILLMVSSTNTLKVVKIDAINIDQFGPARDQQG
jgi:hypothetical protein